MIGGMIGARHGDNGSCAYQAPAIIATWSTPTSRDASRPVATDRDADYTLSLEEVAQLYAKAGHPRKSQSGIQAQQHQAISG
jgi:hypothetical protein